MHSLQDYKPREGNVNIITIAKNGKMCGTKEELLEQIFDSPGNYIWTIRPKRLRAHAVYLGQVTRFSP